MGAWTAQVSGLVAVSTENTRLEKWRVLFGQPELKGRETVDRALSYAFGRS